MQTELTPVEKMVQTHEGFLAHCKHTRMQARLPKYAQTSVQNSLAKDYGYELHGGMWIQMNRTKEGLKLPGYVIEAVKFIEDGLAASVDPVEDIMRAYYDLGGTPKPKTP